MPVLTEAPLQQQRTSLRDQALALLREALVSRRIADGVVYSSKALAAELGRERLYLLLTTLPLAVVAGHGRRAPDPAAVMDRTPGAKAVIRT